jgi:hypothetical protein
MPGYPLTSAATLTCGHGGQVAPTPAPAQARVKIGGSLVLTTADTLTVSGCPGVNGVMCTTVTWTATASQVKAGGQPLLLQATPSGPGGGTVAGPPPPVPQVSTVQQQVSAQ